MRLTKNEIKKTISSKKYIISMGIFLILYMAIGFLMCKDTLSSKPENLLNMNEKSLQYWLKEKSNKGISKERKFEIEKNIKYIERRNKDLKFEIANKNMNWNERLKKQNNDLRERLKEIKLKGNTGAISEYKDKIATNEYYLNNNIKPTPNYEITAFSLLPRINMFVGILIISVIIGIIVSDSVSGEFNPATIKFLLTKPVSRSRILFSKFMASILICVFSFIIIKILAFLVLGIGFRFGSWKEPVTFYAKYVADKDLIANSGLGVMPDLNSLKTYTMLKMVLLSEGINILFVSATASVCFLISTLTKKSSTSISISIILLAIVSFLNTKNLDGSNGSGSVGIHKIMPYLFSTYSSGEFVITGEITRKIGLQFVNIPFIIFILLGWTVICYLISNFIFSRRDILC